MKQLMVLLLLLVAGGIQAQDVLGLRMEDTATRARGQTMEQVAQSKTDKLAQKLGLDKTQKDKVYNICIASLQKKQELNPLKQTNKKDYDTKIKTLVDSTYNKIVAVLNPQQKEKLEKLKAAAQGGQSDI